MERDGSILDLEASRRVCGGLDAGLGEEGGDWERSTARSACLLLSPFWNNFGKTFIWIKDDFLWDIYETYFWNINFYEIIEMFPCYN